MEELAKKKLILFDVDGVLLLSTDASVVLLCHVITKAGLIPDVKLIFENWGHSFESVLIPMLAAAGAWSEDKQNFILEKLAEVFEDIHFKSPDNLALKMKSLKNAGYELGIITNRDQRLVEQALKDICLEKELFTFIKTAEDGIHKPNPEVFNEMLNHFDAEDIVFVGDSPVCDLPAAYDGERKIEFVAITSTIFSSHSFTSKGVPHSRIFRSVTDFIDALISVSLVLV